MKAVFSPHFVRNYHKAPQRQQNLFDKQLRFLLVDLHHPSLHSKIIDEEQRTWQARVDYKWRFLFEIHGDTYYIFEIQKHRK